MTGGGPPLDGVDGTRDCVGTKPVVASLEDEMAEPLVELGEQLTELTSMPTTVNTRVKGLCIRATI